MARMEQLSEMTVGASRHDRLRKWGQFNSKMSPLTEKEKKVAPMQALIMVLLGAQSRD